MLNFFKILPFLPLIEIIGFVMIGGKIGLGWSLLWLLASALVGSSLVKTASTGAFQSAPPQDGPEAVDFMLEDAFGNLCLLIAGLLLIFPGFFSDFMALPFLLGPVRHWLFGRAKNNPDSPLRRFAHEAEGIKTWTYSRTTRHSVKEHTVIEGEYRRIEEKDTRPPE